MIKYLGYSGCSMHDNNGPINIVLSPCLLLLLPLTTPLPFNSSQTKDPMNSGNLLSRYYAIRDADGSLTGTPGFLLGNHLNFLPESSVRTSSCKQVANWGPAWGCAGVCYRAPVLWFNEPSPPDSFYPRTGLPYR